MKWGLALVVLAMGAGVVVVGWQWDQRVRTYLAGPPLGTTRIYAAPSVVRRGMSEPGGSLVRKLTRLGYRRVERSEAVTSGTYRVAGPTIDVFPGPSPLPDAGPPLPARVTVRSGRVTDVRTPEGTALDRLEIEPEILAILGASGATLAAAGERPPAACRDALLAAEDRYFFRHLGVDPLAIMRALWADVRAGAREQGGSTITQQLVKNAFLTPRRTLGRKLEEAMLAVLLELRASKEEILDRYMSSVYLGVDGGLPVHGFAQAADVYFGKPLGELGPAPCALLAGIIRSPNGLAPRRHPRAALARRNRVLALMVRNGALADPAGAQAIAEPLGLADARPRVAGALYVAAEVGRELPRLLPPEIATVPGLAVFTTVDADLQRDAERAVRRQLERLEGRRPRRERLQAALVALDPETGGVRALVGGRDFGSSPLDRALRTRRQPGSAFKPFVYLAALDPTRRGAASPRTVMSLLADEPVAVTVGSSTWRPANYDGTFAGALPLEDALADSRNAATVRLSLDVGVDAVANAARDLGIAAPLPRVPALALGAAEVSLLELTAAYGVFASGGIRRAPTLVAAVTAANGDVLYRAAAPAERVLQPGVAYLMTHLLARVVDAGTGHPARAAGLTGPAAGKTGTTDDTRDAWFVGFTPAVVAGVWVGRDRGGPTGHTGAQAALPIWTDFVRAAGNTGVEEFPVPSGVVWRDVDPISGHLATAECPEHRRAPFLAGTEPEAPCTEHRPVLSAVSDGLGEVGRSIEHGGRRLGEWIGRLFR